MSANWSWFKCEISAPLSGILALSSPHLRPRSVRVRSQSATTTAVCPCPGTIHVRDLAANMSVSSQRTDRDRDLSVAMSGRCASRGRELTAPVSRANTLEASRATAERCAAKYPARWSRRSRHITHVREWSAALIRPETMQ